MVVVVVKRGDRYRPAFLAAVAHSGLEAEDGIECARDTTEANKRGMRLRQKKKDTSVEYKPLQSR